MDGEGAAPAQFTFHRYMPPVGLGDVFNDGKPQPGAAHVAAASLVDPIEPFKEPGEMLPGDAGALVLYPDDDVRARLMGGNLDGALRFTVFDGVVDEVDDSLFQQGWIHGSNSVAGTGMLDLNISCLGLGIARFDGCTRDIDDLADDHSDFCFFSFLLDAR